MKITIAELRRRLPVGTEFTGEFIGPMLLNSTAQRITRRKVKKQTAAQMVSTHLDGPKAGQDIYLDWPGVTADERDGAVTLMMPETGTEFLRITFNPAPTPAS